MSVRYLREAYNNLPKWLTDYLDSQYGKSTKYALSKKGLDLANASYVPDQMITSGRDKRLSDPTKIQIFRFRGSREPYIKGYNQGPYIYDVNKYASSLSGKDLANYADEFGYIDFSANNVSDLRKQRKMNRSGSIDRGDGQYHHQDYDWVPDENERWNIKKIPTGWRWIQSKGQDKSGYPLDPDKYKRMLDEVGLDNYADRLQKYYDKIENYRSQITDIMNNATLDMALDKNRDSDWGSVFDSISNCVRSLDSCISSYRRLKEAIDESIANEQDYPEEYNVNRRIANMFKFYGSSIRRDIDDCKERINTARTKIGL